MLLLKLSTALTLLAFNPFPLSLREHLLVFNTQLAAMDIHTVHGFNDHACVLCRLEVGESQATENTVVKVVVEGVWLRKVHFEHNRSKGLLSYGKGDVLDNNGSGDKLVGIGGV